MTKKTDNDKKDKDKDTGKQSSAPNGKTTPLEEAPKEGVIDLGSKDIFNKMSQWFKGTDVFKTAKSIAWIVVALMAIRAIYAILDWMDGFHFILTF